MKNVDHLFFFVFDSVLQKKKKKVWRVEWNITGTILASSGDDGMVRLWKQNFTGEWKSLGVINGEDE